MSSGKTTLSPQKEVVRKFYKDMWDNADTALIPTIFHHDFTFRGSLGPLLVGHAQFAEYVAWVTQSIGEYTTDILQMVEEDNKVFGQVRFHGIHRRTVFGIEPTNRHIEWKGAPLFTFDGSKVRDLWVLGDIYGLVSRMKNAKDTPPEFSLAS
ncbi:MAG: ester cyclase [Bradyrhizobium sp.]